MLSKNEIQQQVLKARTEDYAKRNFKQAFELVMKLKDIDVKKLDLNINEVVFLPNKLSEQAKICVFASGDNALRAKNAGADRVIEGAELDTLSFREKVREEACARVPVLPCRHCNDAKDRKDIRAVPRSKGKNADAGTAGGSD